SFVYDPFRELNVRNPSISFSSATRSRKTPRTSIRVPSMIRRERRGHANMYPPNTQKKNGAMRKFAPADPEENPVEPIVMAKTTNRMPRRRYSPFCQPRIVYSCRPAPAGGNQFIFHLRFPLCITVFAEALI